MNLSSLDWTIIFSFFALTLVIGVITSKRSGSSASEYFLSGRNMPWWLLGISMVATTFSADTPNLVADIVRKNGVAGNWVWWAYLLTGMLTVFVYARLWRRSGVVTDLEFYELRYSGPAARFLRIFRAFYLGVLFNILVMATVCLAGIKIGSVLLGLSSIQTLLLVALVTVVYSALGGLRGIIYTDFFQFGLAMIGSIWAAIVIVNLPEVGGLSSLMVHENVAGKLNLIPDFSDRKNFISLLIIPLAVQWWASYYPGAEPGGGGYIAQRMLAAKDEKNSMGATLLFNIAHYALRPWPWILIGLASLVVFPDLDSLAQAFPDVEANVINDDLAYPAMLSFLPKGLLGLVIASLIAALMSTLSTHLNWGSSYVVNDIYKRFIKPDASEKEMVNLGKICTVFLMIFAAVLALFLKSALVAFDYIILMGAGTGLIFILRWFWWRINALSEIAAMIISLAVALYFILGHEALGFSPLEGHVQLVWSVGITTLGWILVTLFTKPTDQNVLYKFYNLIRPAKAGWKPVVAQGVATGAIKEADVNTGRLPLQILNIIIATFSIYAALFATGYFIYGNGIHGLIAAAVSGIGILFIFMNWNKMSQGD